MRSNHLADEVNLPALRYEPRGGVKLVQHHMEGTEFYQKLIGIKSRQFQVEDVLPILTKKIKAVMFNIRKIALSSTMQVVIFIRLKAFEQLIEVVILIKQQFYRLSQIFCRL